MSILYEITGFKAESESFDFWDNYRDFEELGEGKLIGRGRDESDLSGAHESDKNVSDSDSDTE